MGIDYGTETEVQMADGPEEFTVGVGDVGHIQATELNTDNPTVVLPDRNQRDHIEHLVGRLRQMTEKRGVKTLLNKLNLYLYHQGLSDRGWDAVTLHTNFVNGVRSTGQSTGDKKRSVRHTAETFYSALSDSLLLSQYRLVFGHGPDAGMDKDAMVEQLVQQYIAMTVTVSKPVEAVSV